MVTQSSSAVPRDGDQPDMEVIDQVLHGQTAMFELLMRRYNERIYCTAARELDSALMIIRPPV
jgi:hypothetical protein